ncbi:SDR family NAD(P)-dependent oxidoreductase [Candidatus Palauibacter polyketidifaciens]|uniref:SDR family NAD(P)-dependent oxidoreductase n=1 Tax=Candidatus Palauibacter polyketidifaciens TaxID=3056740 RepID=UPI00238E3080|nr:SDR family NAD(P)-dependent oxidoreductase [Candidatus Palauibacter polyketidifaciens]MDE2719062.1 SDR family NAD(P)-dependent oxidoreductase [Candidatus Palauibacter polyketidifaciens]
MTTHGNGRTREPGEPIAIVGMACRFPGSRTLSDFWRQLIAGENAVVEGPPGSVIGRAGRLFPDSGGENRALRFGAFIEDLDQFDADFFRISPIEAQMLDPQQRMMLEVSWHALEDAGIDPESLKGSRTGVYVGISNNDYRDMVIDAPETADTAVGFYAVTGTALNTAIGRVSFALGLEGPCMAIDTACSSSLVALHQAVGALQRGETDLALSGGVHIYLAGRPLELRANAGMLSPEGQCKAFDAAADGFVCGEGCGLLVLKRLDAAEAAGDRIWAVIRGSSVNQDGASQGLTVPSGPSQEKAMAEALARGSVSPSDVDYLEAHGTGTVVGDPIELGAAAAVYGRGRTSANPFLVGSVKTNIGHLGPAAGVAGVIKAVLAMRHGVIPRHLNFNDPTPSVDWDRLPVRVTDVMTDWPLHPDRRPLAGVNSFGWSGTNAHVVLEGYGEAVTETATDAGSGPATLRPPVGPAIPVPVSASTPEAADPSDARTTRFLPLSGKSPAALGDVASRHLSWLAEHWRDEREGERSGADTIADMVWTAASGRSHFAHRAGVLFSDVAELRRKLARLAEGQGPEAGVAPVRATNVAFVFTGQASQWVGMGRALYEREPVFRSVLDRCDGLLLEERGVSLLDVMFGSEGADGTDGLLDEAAWTQPAIYALECALTALWESVGVEPSVVVGHSLGEMAAAQAAGVFGLEDGLRFAAARGALMGATRSDGAMAAIFAPAARIASAVVEQNAASDDVDLSVAVDNGLQQVVSGPAKDLEAVLARFEAEGVKVVRLRRSPAYHSALIEPALDDLEAAVRDIMPAPPSPSVPVVSNLTGRLLEPDERMDAAYWRRQAREPVAFRRSVETLAELGVDAVVEIGPHAILGPVVAMTWPETAPSGPPVILASLRRPPRDPAEPVADPSGGFVEAVAGAYEAGMEIGFPGLFAGETRRRISLPGYPFQHSHHWIPRSRRRRTAAGHPLLGMRHESPRGEITFETEMFASDPAWLQDHLVYDRIVAPGALHGAMAVSASLAGRGGSATVSDMQLHSPLIFESEDGEDPEDGAHGAGRKLQFVLSGPEDATVDAAADAAAETPERRFEVFSKGETEETWTLHAGGRLSWGTSGPAPGPEEAPHVDLDELRARLPRRDPAEFYRLRWSGDIHLGPSYHTLQAVWAGKGEALGELALGDSVDASGMEMHPLLLDGCFQISAIARHLMKVEQGAVYLPFGWESLWVAGPLPDRVVCHAVLRTPGSEDGADTPPQVVTGDVRLYAADGTAVAVLKGYTAKRATRSALLSAEDGVKDLLYEVAWRKKPLSGGMRAADYLTDPEVVASRSPTFVEYLAQEGVEGPDRAALLKDQETLSRAYARAALDSLGWEREAGEAVRPDDLRRQLGVTDDHRRLFVRLLDLAAGDPSPDGPHGSDGFLLDPGPLAERFIDGHPHGINELGLLRRCGSALAEVLRGRRDPLGLLFGDDGPSAASLYLTAPASRAANRMLGDAVAAAVSGLPENRRLRILEVGAGTGSATESILPLLPSGRFDYTFTDISAGFFAQAEARFAATGAPIEYRALDIEASPEAQGFEAHAYDLVIAANVLHATRDLGETLAHCRDLLAPSGLLLALEGLRRRAWQDLTFGLLDGWWRFEDDYRPDHALATPAVWRRALGDAGFLDIEFPGLANPDTDEPLGSNVIIARGPRNVALSPGVWVLAADETGRAAEMAAGLARALASRDQTVVFAGDAGDDPATVDVTRRESWRALLEGLPADVPLKGVVHLAALDGHGAAATTEQMAEDVARVGSSALALVQGLIDTGATPTDGVWFVTRGAQVLEEDLLARSAGELAGSTLWGFGKVMALEAAHLRPRLIDLDPGAAGTAETVSNLAREVLFPDAETHIAYRGGSRQGARLVRLGAGRAPLALPEDADWVVGPTDPAAGLSALGAKPRPKSPLEPGEVRISVEAVGLNFADVLLSIGAVPYDREIGREMYGRVLETAPDVEVLSAGDTVVGLGFGSYTPEMVTSAVALAPAPDGFSAPALATMPVCFVTAELAFEMAGLTAGERVLVHAGTGGVGLAAIQLARAAGADVFATASVAKQPWLRSLGVDHVFDSRQTDFGEEILDATGGEGVHVVLNSLTGEGFIEASLSCLGTRGRFVEIGKREIWSEEEMLAARPDVAYSVLDLDGVKLTDLARAGASLARVMGRLSSGELRPLPHTVWPLSELQAALDVMRDARHTGKNVVRMPPVARDGLRPDRTYLVTGGLGGIGCAVARWLAEKGAATIVLNGRRAPDPDAEAAIRELREGGVDVRVEVADVTDPAAIDHMLTRIDETLPPLGGVVHSVGVLSDGVIENQNWERFEEVLWPKVLGAWHLHRATMALDLDLFILFSSVTGVVGNPGQTNHAAANAFLDQVAAHRRALGLPGQAIAWGAWSGIGEAEEQRERIEKQLAYTGAGWITPRQGIEAFDWLVRQDVTQSTVTSVDWSVSGEGLESRPRFLEDLIVTKKARRGTGEAPASSDGLMSRLREAPADDKENLLSAFIQEELKAVLRLPSSPSATASFFDLGMDSLMAVELRNRLNRAFAGEYAASNTVVFDYPNSAGLAEHLSKELGALTGAEPATEPVAEPVTEVAESATEPVAPAVRTQFRRDDDDIAIVGMACRFPGAPDIDAFWRQLEEGEDAVSEGRADRGSWEGVVGDPGAEDPLHRRGAFVEDIDRFDSRFFRIAPIEARTMDPQQRMLLETSWQAIEDAGIDPGRLAGSRTGVYVGVGGSEYRDLFASRGQPLDYGGTNEAMTVGRVAFALGLEGPAIPLDMACASSLAAVHQAVAGLQRDEVDMALAGGVNAILSPGIADFLAELGVLSPSGRCRAFDAAADGFVRGEGCGMIVLKRLADARDDGDRIWGVVHGSAVNQSGRSAELMAPNGPTQERVMEEALARAGVDPGEVDYLEAQGVGSEFGDPIELNAVAAVYGRGRDADDPLLVGSVKTNIGHLEWAAGIASLIKTVLAMNRGVIPGNLHFRDPSPLLDWKSLPVRVASGATAWPGHSGRAPLAAVNTFGLSGANAHVVVGGYANPAADDGTVWPAGPVRTVAVTGTTAPEGLGERTTRFLPLSGKSPDALRELARRYLDFVGKPDGSSLADVAWTAGRGRSHFAYRAGLVFDDLAQLREGLRDVAAGRRGPADPEPLEAPRTAFLYTGGSRSWAGMGQALYETEPVVREVLDTCEEVWRGERGASLLEVLFGKDGAKDDVGDAGEATSVGASIYALQCGLTALWRSVGISPTPVVGCGVGELAAAQAAGVWGLEEGLRLWAEWGGREAPRDISLAAPAVTLVSGATGVAVGSGDARDVTYWQRSVRELPAIDRCLRTLAEMEVPVVVEIGPESVLAPMPMVTQSPGEGTAPVLLSSLSAVQPADGFVAAVAGAYEAGLEISFEGLFAGEARSRVPLPGYPFQRRRHWLEAVA